MSRRFVAVGLSAASMAACSAPAASNANRWVEDTSVALPARLSEVGFIDELSSLAVYEDVHPYVPNHALYSNRLRKERHLYLPPNTQIDVGDDEWRFPVGTVLSKTFLEGDAPVETRLLFLTDEGWDYGIYEWLPDGTDAEKLEGNWAEVTVTLADGEKEHTLPSRLDCRTCHETHEAVAAVPVLGISELQTAEDLVEAEVFSERPKLEPVQGRTAEETAALGYFLGNCVSCHNGGDSINSSFSLYPGQAVANTVNQSVESETGEGVRVVAGDRDRSVLYVSVVEAGEPQYRGPFKAMPPLGVNVTDSSAEVVLGEWIDNL